MVVSRLAHMPRIGVNIMGDRADAAADPTMLRMLGDPGDRFAASFEAPGPLP